MRREYETEHDVATERDIILRLLPQIVPTVRRAKKLPKRYSLDWVAEDNDGFLMAWVECKRRHCSARTYPTFMISMLKWMDALHFQMLGGKPTYILVQWDDGAGWVRSDEVVASVKFSIGGRTDRDDPEDMEPCVHIPVHCFHMLPASSPGKRPARFEDTSSNPYA